MSAVAATVFDALTVIAMPWPLLHVVVVAVVVLAVVVVAVVMVVVVVVLDWCNGQHRQS